MKQIHVELIQDDILCQKSKSNMERQVIYDTRDHQTATVSQSVNFNQVTAYFWINPNIDLESRLTEMKESLSQTSD